MQADLAWLEAWLVHREPQHGSPAVAAEELRQCNQALSRSQAIMQHPKAEDIIRRLSITLGEYLWWPDIPTSNQLATISAIRGLYAAADAHRLVGSESLAWFWDSVLATSPCAEKTDQSECDEILQVIIFALSLPNAACQYSALEGLQRLRPPNARQILDRFERSWADDNVRKEASFVRGSLRRT